MPGSLEITESGTIDRSKVPFWISSRIGLAILGFFGFVNVYALRVNLSVAIVCMVNQTALRAQYDVNSSRSAVNSECEGLPLSNSSNVTAPRRMLEDGQHIWDKTVQGLVLGSYFWGYLVSQVPSGWLATKIGGKRVFGWAICVSGLLTLLTPVLSDINYIVLLVVRIVLGAASGVCFPAMHAMWGQWAPPLERSKLAAFTYAGAQVGNVITFPLSGFLCKYGFAGGWPSIFYILGGSSLIWFVLWMFLTSDSPAQHKRITEIEKKYIEHCLKDSAKPHDEKTLDVPWKSIVTSMPVWAIVVSNTTSDWGAYTLMTNIPTYMKEVLKFDIASNGLLSALPYIFFWLLINVSGWLADFIRKRKFLSTTVTRKSFDAFGKLVPAAMLVGLGYVDCTQPVTGIVLLLLGVCLTGFQYSGFVVNHVDLAPAYAGILFGISNSIAAVTGFISPVVVGVITSERQTRTEWQYIFYIAAAIYGFGAIFYIIFASGELQSWARDKKEPEGEIMVKLNSDGKVVSDKNEEQSMMKNQDL